MNEFKALFLEAQNEHNVDIKMNLESSEKPSIPASCASTSSLDPSRVPLVSLSGVTCLSDVLSELPIPTPLPDLIGGPTETLFFHQRVADEAYKYGNSTDPNFVSTVTNLLSTTNADDVVVKTEYKVSTESTPVVANILAGKLTAPVLLKSVLQIVPGIFERRQSKADESQLHHGQTHDYNLPSTGVSPGTLTIPGNSSGYGNNHSQDGQKDFVPDHLRHLFSQEPIVEVERIDITHNRITSIPRSADEASESVKKRIVSIGKQPKGKPHPTSAAALAASKKKKTMVSELFDSLTPAAEYFAEGSRRRRGITKNYNEYEALMNLESVSESYSDDQSATNDIPLSYQANVHEQVFSPDEIAGHGTMLSHKRSHKISKFSHGDEPYEYQQDPARTPTPTEVAKERDEQWQEVAKKRREKRRRRCERSGGVYQMIDPDELVENESYRKFCSAIDTVFDNAEDVDFSAETGDDEDEISAESLIPRHVMIEICAEANKLKILGAMNRVPLDRLTKLITVLEKNVKDGAKSMPFIDEKQDAEESAAWKEAMTERVVRSADAALIALTIMTSPSMPKQVFVEDTIELSVSFVKFQLQHVIFPAFDPLYRVGKEKTVSGCDSDADPATGHKQHKRSRASTAVMKNKILSNLYGKTSELIGCFADLVEAQTLTDTTILQLSSLGVTPFFVEGIEELQLHALRLVANIFSRYPKHRKLILEDILASLARLPSTKRGLRSYRLSTNESIQMVSALIMRLVQSVVQVSTAHSKSAGEYEDTGREGTSSVQDSDVLINTSYDNAMRTAHTFLSAYLKKCTTKSEDDYRPLFEAFVEDLLTTVHKPDWPAAELLLSLLGNLLVQYFSNKQIEMTLRVASLDYLGVVASRLRKDAVASQLDDEQLQRILRTLTENERTEDEEGFVVAASGMLDTKRIKIRLGARRPENSDKIQTLQRALVDYLTELKENDPTVEYAKNFYIAQWYKDSVTEVSKPKTTAGDENEPCDVEKDAKDAMEQDQLDAIAQKTASKRQFLLSLNERDGDSEYGGKLRRDSSVLSEEEASFVVRYLASKRPFSQSFDIYLAQILRVLNDTTIAVRTKAMKCLSAVVEADPSVLGRNDIQQAVHARLLDQSSSVREAAVDLIGKFICAQPDFIDKYYKMILDRILDTGISVRKRVIKILKDICERRPDLDKIPEICVRILRRANDEESVKKLVVETFHGLWFLPVREKDTATLMKKVMTIIEVVGTFGQDIGTQYDGFEILLSSLLKKDAALEKSCMIAAHQIVNCLVDNVLTLEEKLTETSIQSSGHSRLLSCLTTLYLFSKIRPPLLVPHAETMQPYLLMSCTTRNEQAVMVQVIKILEMVVPLMERPSPGFLGELEETLMRLASKQGPQIIQACISCLSAVVNGLTKNYQLIQNQFFRYFGNLLKLKNEMECKLSRAHVPKELKAPLLRALFTVGLLCRYFDLDETYPEDRKPETPWKEQVFRAFMFFTGSIEEDVRLKALAALGALCIRQPDYLIQSELKQLYCSCMRLIERVDQLDPANQQEEEADERLKCQVLRNIESFLREEEAKLMKCNDEWDSSKKAEDLKELGESASGLGSSVIQHYLRDVEECYFHNRRLVRVGVGEVVVLTLQQGLVHPAQCIPHVIAMQTDTEQSIRVKADKVLKEVETKYPGFVQTKAVEGIKLSVRLQKILCQSQDGKSHQEQNLAARHGKSRGIRATSSYLGKGPRGLRLDQNGPQALNSQLYAVIRSGKGQRRAFLRALFHLFDENSKTSLEEMIYVVDNLASFPYQIVEEPLFICHHADIVVSVNGATFVQAFQEALLPKPKPPECQVMLSPMDVVQLPPGTVQYGDAQRQTTTCDDDDDEEELTIEDLLARLPADYSRLESCVSSGQGCLLLLTLKQYLKDLYGITDSKLQEYSPSESSKGYDKALNRKQSSPPFVPTVFSLGTSMDLESRYQLCQQFLEFKRLMMSIDTHGGFASDEDTAAGPSAPINQLIPFSESTIVAPQPKKRSSKGGKKSHADLH